MFVTSKDTVWLYFPRMVLLKRGLDAKKSRVSRTELMYPMPAIFLLETRTVIDSMLRAIHARASFNQNMNVHT